MVISTHCRRRFFFHFRKSIKNRQKGHFEKNRKKKRSSIENSKKKGRHFSKPKTPSTHSWFFAKTKKYLVWICFEDPKYLYFLWKCIKRLLWLTNRGHRTKQYKKYSQINEYQNYNLLICNTSPHPHALNHQSLLDQTKVGDLKKGSILFKTQNTKYEFSIFAKKGTFFKKGTLFKKGTFSSNSEKYKKKTPSTCKTSPGLILQKKSP